VGLTILISRMRILLLVRHARLQGTPFFSLSLLSLMMRIFLLDRKGDRARHVDRMYV
jgi:hypothetical protein